jgi:hypothetical protein
MKRSILILALASVTLISTNSCQKETEGKSELQKKAADLGNYVVNNKFIPVDFYSDTPIDYIETDAQVLAEKDLKKYIFPYLADDVITFNPNNTLIVDQGTIKMETKPEKVFQATNWSTDFSKAKNLVYLTYLDYFYAERRYNLVSWDTAGILVYIDWTSKADPTKTAKLYTKFLRVN